MVGSHIEAEEQADAASGNAGRSAKVQSIVRTGT
jgi:hypothetical protein